VPLRAARCALSAARCRFWSRRRRCRCAARTAARPTHGGPDATIPLLATSARAHPARRHIIALRGIGDGLAHLLLLKLDVYGAELGGAGRGRRAGAPVRGAGRGAAWGMDPPRPGAPRLPLPCGRRRPPRAPATARRPARHGPGSRAPHPRAPAAPRAPRARVRRRTPDLALDLALLRAQRALPLADELLWVGLLEQPLHALKHGCAGRARGADAERGFRGGAQRGGRRVRARARPPPAAGAVARPARPGGWLPPPPGYLGLCLTRRAPRGPARRWPGPQEPSWRGDGGGAGARRAPRSVGRLVWCQAAHTRRDAANGPAAVGR
jgi:hypothetical protein